MSKSINDLLGRFDQDGGRPQLDGPNLSPPEQGLLDACWAWRLGGLRLEEDERVQAYIQQDPSHLKVVRALEQLLTAGRFAARRRPDNGGTRVP